MLCGWGGNRAAGGKCRQPNAVFMASVTCGLTAEDWLRNQDKSRTTTFSSNTALRTTLVIHAEHVVQSAWILFSLWMYVCMFVCMLALSKENA